MCRCRAMRESLTKLNHHTSLLVIIQVSWTQHLHPKPVAPPTKSNKDSHTNVGPWTKSHWIGSSHCTNINYRSEFDTTTTRKMDFSEENILIKIFLRNCILILELYCCHRIFLYISTCLYLCLLSTYLTHLP